jgi:hypothetical protein
LAADIGVYELIESETLPTSGLAHEDNEDRVSACGELVLGFLGEGNWCHEILGGLVVAELLSSEEAEQARHLRRLVCEVMGND